MKYEDMNVEELRAEIVKRDKELQKAKESNKIFADSLKTKDEEINSYLNDIKELKLKNYDLFIQIPKVDNAKPVEENKVDNILSINDITNNLMEGME